MTKGFVVKIHQPNEPPDRERICWQSVVGFILLFIRCFNDVAGWGVFLGFLYLIIMAIVEK